MSGDVVPAGTLTAQQSVTMLNEGVLIYFFVLRRVQTLTLGPLVNAGVVFDIVFQADDSETGSLYSVSTVPAKINCTILKYFSAAPDSLMLLWLILFERCPF